MEDIETLEPQVKRKTENEKLSDELANLFTRIIPDELKIASHPTQVVSVASGHFVPEAPAIYSVIPSVNGFRAVDTGIPPSLLGLLNQEHKELSGFYLENGDVSQPKVLGRSKYDLAILRNPQVGHSVNKSEVGSPWDKIITNTLDSVRPGGFAMISGHTMEEFDRIMLFINKLGSGFVNVSQERPINPKLTAGVPMKEEGIAVLKKPVATR